MTKEEQFEQENLEAMSMANRLTVPSPCTGYSVPASHEDTEAMNMANGFAVPVFERDTYYHIEASAEDAEAMAMVHDAPKPLSPGSIHRTYTVNEDGQVEAVVPDDYRESRPTRIAKCAGIAALGSCVLSCAANSAVKELTGFVVYIGLAAGVGLVGALARR